jgi:predicted transcriptional regulator
MSKRERQHGQLEAAVLDALWAIDTDEALTSQQVQDAVNAATNSDLALTTVLTVLSRLVDKGMVVRRAGEGRALMFSAARSREQHTADVMLSLVAESDNPLLAFSHFARGLSPAALAQLRETLNGE